MNHAVYVFEYVGPNCICPLSRYEEIHETNKTRALSAVKFIAQLLYGSYDRMTLFHDEYNRFLPVINTLTTYVSTHASITSFDTI